jgi:hypothetical protein
MSMSYEVMRTLKPLTALAAGGVLALATGFGPPVHAQGAVAGYVGEAASLVAGCPWLGWRLARTDNGVVTGMAYYSDASGISAVTGTMGTTPDSIHLVLRSIQGKGPEGTVAVTKSSDGKPVIKLTGEGCANTEVPIRPLPNLNVNPNGARPTSP